MTTSVQVERIEGQHDDRIWISLRVLYSDNEARIEIRTAADQSDQELGFDFCRQHLMELLRALQEWDGEWPHPPSERTPISAGALMRGAAYPAAE